MPRDSNQDSPKRKRRTRGHVLEDLSENYLERFVLLKGHLLRRPNRDYGVDVTMFHFAENGELENGEVRFQLKATDRLSVVNQGTEVSVTIKSRDLHYWALEIYPFILIVFDALAEAAYWLDIKEYIQFQPEAVDLDRQSVNVRVPIANKLTLDSIEYFRSKSLTTIHNVNEPKGQSDVKRKPR